MSDKSRNEALRIKFVPTDKSTVVHVGDMTVPMEHLVRTLISLNLTSCSSFEVYIEECRIEKWQQIVITIRKVVFFVRNSFDPVERLVMSLADWTLSSQLGDVLTDIFSTLTHLELTYSLPLESRIETEKEADLVQSFLTIALGHASLSIMRLRIYPFIRFDSHLQSLFEKCASLKYLTISKLQSIRESAIFRGIGFIELDGDNVAMSTDEVRHCQKLPQTFPNCRVYRVTGHHPSIFFSLLRSLVNAGGTFSFYTPLDDVGKVEKMLGGTMQVVSYNRDSLVAVSGTYDTTIQFFSTHIPYEPS